MTETKTRAILYARYSSDMQSPTSIIDQLRICREYASRQGWQVVGEHSDSEFTGSRRDRPGFEAVQFAIGGQACDFVVAESLDRFSRDPEHTAAFYKLTQFHKVEIHEVGYGKCDGIKISFGSTLARFYLDQLADKTRRGLEGRIEVGKSAGGLSYGYCLMVNDAGEPVKGEIAIDETQAAVVKRIFREYSEGRSPLKIAAGLNEDGIPAPRGRGAGSGHWKQNTINGNRQRGNGILNNELYIGRRIWNRQSFVRHPITGKRVGQANPREDWKISEVPSLRIVDVDLWQAAKQRQAAAQKTRSAIATTDRNGLSASRELRPRRYLLSGLLECGACGGSMTVAGSGAQKRYYCANAKEKGPSVCKGLPGVKERLAAKTVLSCISEGLMTDEAYRQFRAKVETQIRATQGSTLDMLRRHDTQVRELEKTRANLMRAVEQGKFSDPIIDQLNRTDADLKAMHGKRAALVPVPAELPDDLPELYRAHVADLVETLSDELVAGRAGDELRNLIERVVVSWDAEIRAHRLEVVGNLVGMLKRAKPAGEAGFVSNKSSLELVAGTGFEPVTFRL